MTDHEGTSPEFLEPKFDPEQAELADAEIDENTDNATIVERLKRVGDHKDVLIGAAVVGAAVGVMIARKHFKSSTPEGHKLIASKRGVVASLVEISGKSGSKEDLAASFPIGAAALKAIRESAPYSDLFAMRIAEGRNAFPLTGDSEQIKTYGRAVRKAAGWVANHLRSNESDKDSGA